MLPLDSEPVFPPLWVVPVEHEINYYREQKLSPLAEGLN